MQYELMNIKEVAAMVRISIPTIYRLVKLKQFPAPIRVGAAAMRWKTEEMRDWLDSRPRTTDAPISGPGLAA